MVGPGSSYHLSSLRYAKSTSSNAVSLPPLSSEKVTSKFRRLDRLFEKAEDDYRSGQSSSSTFLIRSNVVPLEVIDAIDESHDRDANEGFQRTKARSLLAQSVSNGDIENDDLTYPNAIAESGGSIYVPRRRARHPLSRTSYEEDRRKRRLVKDRAKQRAKEERAATMDVVEVADEDGSQRSDENESNAQNQRDTELDARISYDTQTTRDLLPNGSLLETIHYLASHYYDARGMLSSPSKVSLLKDSISKEGDFSRSLYRAYEGNALIALGVYLEELAKYELVGQGADVESKKREAVDAEKALLRLNSVRKEIGKVKRRSVIEEKRGGRTITTESDWARVPRRIRKRKTIESISSDRSSNSDDNSTEEDEDETDSEEIDESDSSNSSLETDSGYESER